MFRGYGSAVLRALGEALTALANMTGRISSSCLVPDRRSSASARTSRAPRGEGPESYRERVRRGGRRRRARDIDEGALRTATDDLTSAGHDAIGVTCNVADEAQAAAMVERAVTAFGRLDMTFNNAGVVGTQAIWPMSPRTASTP
jgi:NAD(P)-dependent dehydrogenase (short-subunit alcohol dehydrogenase family)